VVKNEEYYAIGHFSKFIRPGALRVSFSVSEELPNVGIVSFLNPDGSKAMVAANYGNDARVFNVNQGGKYITCYIPAKSVATIIWK
jgi:glucosylceramidase